MPYLPHSDADIKSMLQAIGVERVEDLWSSIPEAVRLTRPLNLPRALSDLELERVMADLAGANKSMGQQICFAGGGTYFHHVPAIVDFLLSRSEFYTAYTPYQPEISQGTLQAIFEYQTMISELTGMEVANASMYEAGSAAAEAVLMAERISPKNDKGAVLIAGALNPRYRRVIDTYLSHSRRKLVTVAPDISGRMEQAVIAESIKGALCLVIQHPNYFGCIEDVAALSGIAHENGAVVIVVTSEPLAFGLIKPPGQTGADIAVGNGQSFGIPAGYGGPHLGYFASRLEHVRRMPGRLVGETVDAEGRRGFVLTLSTREQHIRRAKATSNICSNQGLCALAATIYLSLIGRDGLTGLARLNFSKAEYLKSGLARVPGVALPFSAPTFNEFVIELSQEADAVRDALLMRGILAGIPLHPDFRGMSNRMLVSVTERITRREMDTFVEELTRVLDQGSSGKGGRL